MIHFTPPHKLHALKTVRHGLREYRMFQEHVPYLKLNFG